MQLVEAESWVLCEVHDVTHFNRDPIVTIRSLRPIVFRGVSGPHVPIWESAHSAELAAKTLRAQEHGRGRVYVCKLFALSVVVAGEPTVEVLSESKIR